MSSGVRFMGRPPSRLAVGSWPIRLLLGQRSTVNRQLSVEYKPEKTPQKVDRQKQQHRRPVDAACLVRGKDAAERAHERIGHARENLVELHEEVVRAAVAPAERRRRGEEGEPGNDDPGEGHPEDDAEDDVDDADERRDPAHQFRSPKMARPTRTIVAPSSMAVSKSSVMPIDSSSTPRSSRSARSAPNHRRASSCGGMAITPRRRSASSLRTPPASAAASGDAVLDRLQIVTNGHGVSRSYVYPEAPKRPQDLVPMCAARVGAGSWRCAPG